MSGKFLLFYICNFHVLRRLLLIFICKLHWNRHHMKTWSTAQRAPFSTARSRRLRLSLPRPLEDHPWNWGVTPPIGQLGTCNRRRLRGVETGTLDDLVASLPPCVQRRREEHSRRAILKFAVSVVFEFSAWDLISTHGTVLSSSWKMNHSVQLPCCMSTSLLTMTYRLTGEFILTRTEVTTLNPNMTHNFTQIVTRTWHDWSQTYGHSMSSYPNLPQPKTVFLLSTIDKSER